MLIISSGSQQKQKINNLRCSTLALSTAHVTHLLPKRPSDASVIWFGFGRIVVSGITRIGSHWISNAIGMLNNLGEDRANHSNNNNDTYTQAHKIGEKFFERTRSPSNQKHDNRTDERGKLIDLRCQHLSVAVLYDYLWLSRPSVPHIQWGSAGE